MTTKKGTERLAEVTLKRGRCQAGHAFSAPVLGRKDVRVWNGIQAEDLQKGQNYA